MSAITINLTPAERQEFIDQARKELVDRLYNELAEDIQIISKARLAGLLDIDGKTLEAMNIPRVNLTGKLSKYLLKTVAKWLREHEDR